MSALLEVGLGNALSAAGLAVLAVILSRLHPKPALAHALWLLVLVKLVTPPIVPVPVVRATASARELPGDAIVLAEPALHPEMPGHVDRPVVEPDVDASAMLPADSSEFLPQAVIGDVCPVQAPQQAPPVDDVRASASSGVSQASELIRRYWQGAVFAAWGVGSAIWFVVAIVRVLRFRRLLRHVRPVPTPLLTHARQLANKLGLSPCPEVWLLPGAVSPMLWAVSRRAKLLLPAQLLERLDLDQQRALLVHELAHLKRRDHWVRALELVATGLYWWHPVLWWARRELREAEELCCDAWVVWALPGSARAYALALVETLDYLAGAPRSLPVAASGIGPFPVLKRRFTMIMQGRTPRALGWAGALGVMGLGLALLPWGPSWSQERERDRERREAEKRDADRRADDRREEARRQAEQAERDVRRAVEGRDRERAEALQQAQAELRAMTERLEAERQRAVEQLERAKRQVEALERELGAVRSRRAEADGRREEPRRDAPATGRRVEAEARREAGREGEKPVIRREVEIRREVGERDRPPDKPGTPKPPSARFGAGMGGFGTAGPGGMPGMGAMGGGPGGPRDAERRLAELEKKMERLLEEMREMRNEMRRGTPRGFAPGETPTGVTATTPAAPYPSTPALAPVAVPVAPGQPAPPVRVVLPSPAAPATTPVTPIPAPPPADGPRP